MGQVIPEAAVEAAARAMTPAVWGPSVWTFTAHGETPTDARDRVRRQSLEDARRALEAAAPHMLAEAFDHGRSVQHYTSLGWSIEDAVAIHADKTPGNPYRPTT